MTSLMPVQVSAVEIRVGGEGLHADLALPPKPRGLILFAHGSGSGRRSPRNQTVARALQTQGFATLLADLLTLSEEAVDCTTGHLRFDIGLLGDRVMALAEWSRSQPLLEHLPIGLFGASTGAAAALVAAAAHPDNAAAVVSRGGRPDLAGEALTRVAAPTLLIVGSLDTQVIELNRQAMSRMRCPVSIDIIAGASHLFEEAGTLEQVAARAAAWFARFLPPAETAPNVVRS